MTPTCGSHGACVDGRHNYTSSCALGYHSVTANNSETCVEINEYNAWWAAACFTGTQWQTTAACSFWRSDRTRGGLFPGRTGGLDNFASPVEYKNAPRKRQASPSTSSRIVLKFCACRWSGDAWDPALAYLLTHSVGTTDKRFEVEVPRTLIPTCLVSGALSQSSACKRHTKFCQGEFHYKEKMTYECLDGYRAGGALGEAVFCRADAFAVVWNVCKPVSGEELTYVGNIAVHDTDDATTGVTSGETTTSSRQANGVLQRSRGRLRNLAASRITPRVRVMLEAPPHTPSPAQLPAVVLTRRKAAVLLAHRRRNTVSRTDSRTAGTPAAQVMRS